MNYMQKVENYVNEVGRTSAIKSAEALGLGPRQTRNCLSRLALYGKIRRLGDGQYASASTSPEVMINRFLRTPAGQRLA